VEVGDPSKFVTHTMTVISTGKVAASANRGILLIIGKADRGPAMTALGVSSGAEALAYFRSGDLYTASRQAFNNGVNQAYLIRPLGLGYARASLIANDSQSPGVKAGTWLATSHGNWGNGPVITVDEGDTAFTDVEVFKGNGTVGPYKLKFDNLETDPVHLATNYVRVGGTDKTPVYDTDDLGAGKVFIDTTEGSVLFYSNEGPKDTDQISLAVKVKSIKVTMQDGQNRPEVYNNIKNQVMLAAKTKYSAIAVWEPDITNTHLPKPGVTSRMTGGSDGAAITLDDWQSCFDIAMNLPGGIVPDVACITSYEVEEGSDDLVAMLDAYLNAMADKFKWLRGFIAVDPTASKGELLELASGYNNMFLTIGGNYYNETGVCIVGAVAGKCASLELASSMADELNVLNGVGGVIYQFNDSEVEELTENGIDVLIKESADLMDSNNLTSRGVRPYAGISTNSDGNFKLDVDVRTICWNVRALKSITDQFYHKRLTKENLGRIKGAVTLMIEQEKNEKILDTGEIFVVKDSQDKDKVNNEFWIQPVGHILRFHTTMFIGYYSDEIA